MKTLLKIVFGVVLYVLFTIYSGYAFSLLWEWFLVPMFPLSPLSVAQAIGVIMIAQYLTYQIKKEDLKDDRSYLESVIHTVSIGIAKPTAAIVIGAIVKQFI